MYIQYKPHSTKKLTIFSGGHPGLLQRDVLCGVIHLLFRVIGALSAVGIGLYVVAGVLTQPVALLQLCAWGREPHRGENRREVWREPHVGPPGGGQGYRGPGGGLVLGVRATVVVIEGLQVGLDSGPPRQVLTLIVGRKVDYFLRQWMSMFVDKPPRYRDIEPRARVIGLLSPKHNRTSLHSTKLLFETTELVGTIAISVSS